MFALLGMQLFGGQCGSEDGSRLHFDMYGPAMLTVLIAFSGGWVDAYVGCSSGSASEAASAIFFLLAVVLGCFVLINLFIAVLLEALTTEEPEEEEEESGEKEDMKNNAVKNGATSIEEYVPPVRTFCRSVIANPATEWFIVGMIGASSVALALDTPTTDPDSFLAQTLSSLNIIFAFVFTVECLIKLHAYDPAIPPNGYLTSAWNRLDLAIVIISLVSLCPEMGPLSFLRILRVLRPLRLLSRVDGMQLIFDFIQSSSADVVNVAGVLLFFHALFAVVGMELFMDTFGSCTDPSILTRADCHPPLPASAPGGAPFSTPGRLLKGGGSAQDFGNDTVVQWRNPAFGSFDDFGSSMLILYTSATGDGCNYLWIRTCTHRLVLRDTSKEVERPERAHV